MFQLMMRGLFLLDNSQAKKYSNTKLAFSISETILSFVILFLFTFLGLSIRLEMYLRTFSNNNYFVFIVYVLVLIISSTILFFPVNYYTDFYLEHKYNLSNQSFLKWIWEGSKAAMIGAAFGIPLLLLFYYMLQKFGIMWWLPFGIILFIFSVVLAQIVPVLILPLFYKVTLLENESLKEKIMHLCKNAGLKVGSVFKFDMSKNTKKANAAFTGLGKTKRILLGDTLLDNYAEDEIETVIAHELGHYKKKHIVKNIVIGTLSSFLTFYLIAHLHEISLGWFGFTGITQISSLPLLGLWAAIVGLIQTPLSNYISRKFEYEADNYAITSTNKADAFIKTLEKLTDQNLGDREPHPFVEWFFYSHPSIKNRIANIKTALSGLHY
jgi:STE24 endopeptidase